MHASRRTLLLTCAVLAAGALTGCTATSTQQTSSNMTFVPPTINSEAQAILAYNALNGSSTHVALGAGDRFGNMFYTEYVAFVRAANGLNPMYAGVDVSQHAE